MHRRAALLVLLLAAAPPLAHGAPLPLTGHPLSFGAIWPLDGDALAVVHNGSVGHYRIGDGNFSAFADLGPFTRHAVSPDGAWAVLRRVTHMPEHPEFNDSVFAIETASGNATALRPGDIRALAEGGGRVALTTGDNDSIWLWRWGAWDEPQRIEGPIAPADGSRVAIIRHGNATPPRIDGSGIHHAALSPDGHLLAFVQDGFLYAWNLTTGGVVNPTGDWLGRDPVKGLAFSPDGARLAVLTSQQGRFSELRTYSLLDDRVHLASVHRSGDEGLGLSWGPLGIGATYARRERPYDPVGDAYVRLFPDWRDLSAHEETRLELRRLTGAIAQHQGRLLVGEREGLLVLDADLHEVFRSRPGHPPEFAPRPWGGPMKTLPSAPPPPSGETPAPPSGADERAAPGASAALVLMAAAGAAPALAARWLRRHRN